MQAVFFCLFSPKEAIDVQWLVRETPLGLEVYFMTQTEKNKIVLLKQRGMTYSEISTITGINANSIASFLRRNKNMETKEQIGICKNCGKRLSSKRQKKFCSDVCKNAWWNLHRDEKGSYASHKSSCLCCGKQINTYGNKRKKYCSHDCYIQHRFGKAGKENA